MEKYLTSLVKNIYSTTHAAQPSKWGYKRNASKPSSTGNEFIMEIKSSYSINPDGIYSMLGEMKTNALFNLTVHKKTKRKRCVLSVIGSKQKWKHCVPLLTAGQNHCHNGGCSPYTNTSLPCTSSHWWALCPWQAAGRRYDTLYHTCHTPAFCCHPLGSYQPDGGKKNKNRID